MEESAYQIVTITRGKDKIFTRAQRRYLKDLAVANARALKWVRRHSIAVAGGYGDVV